MDKPLRATIPADVKLRKKESEMKFSMLYHPSQFGDKTIDS